MENITATLKEQWDTFKKENPKTRIRDAAKQLAVSEAELVETGQTNILLKPDFQTILKKAENLGYVMALTRNDYCVHERKGVYNNLSFNGSMGLAVNPDIDLRLFMNRWHFAFAVNENDRLSLQFFDKDGSAVHKIYLTEKSNVEAYHQLVEKFKNKEDQAIVVEKPEVYEKNETPDAEIDVPAFQKSWLELRDTHDFFGMLKKYKVSRTQAMRLAPEGHSKPISLETFKKIIHAVSERQIPIMVFTASAGCIQIHTGEVKNLMKTGPWFNVLDPEFNMHLNLPGISTVWVVRKPTVDGIVTGLELFDENGNTIAQFFGKRKPGIPESYDWKAVVNEVTCAKI